MVGFDIEKLNPLGGEKGSEKTSCIDLPRFAAWVTLAVDWPGRVPWAASRRAMTEGIGLYMQHSTLKHIGLDDHKDTTCSA